ncbi:MAG TPA: hypothetical protein VM364_15135 [Vicinamibacterales bacterium]|nr:hypothetical protein [Vicinamibacterales bacterium]
MKKLFALMIPALVATGCAPLLVPPPMTAHRGPFARPAAVAPLPPPVVGRWDNVVGIQPGTLLGVISADGTARTGRFAGAGLRWLRLHSDGAEIELPREDVLRVDVLPQADRVDEGEVVKGAARGALALGGLMMAVPYLLTGDVYVPPARFWATGAVVGAAGAIQEERFLKGGRTIYVASELVR